MPNPLRRSVHYRAVKHNARINKTKVGGRRRLLTKKKKKSDHFIISLQRFWKPCYSPSAKISHNLSTAYK